MKNNLEDYSRYCQIVGATDVGCKRAANEDFLGNEDTQNGRVAVVCDGMGGHVGGATASHIAVDSILAYLREHYHADPNEAITEAIFTANRNILLHAQMHPELTGMGSTCVLLLVRNGKVYIGHVGDSRIYLIRESTIRQLTKDHSFVQTLVDAGQISEAEAEHHPRKNEITNALGIPNMQPATIREEPILPQAGDVFLLCSDGLSNMVPNATIAKIAGKIGTNMQQRADSLIEHARENGGLDNITCELVEFSITTAGESGHSPNGNKHRKLILLLGILTAALLLLGGGGYLLWEYLTTPQPITRDLGTVAVPQNKKIYTIGFREGSTFIQNSSGDTTWKEVGFKAVLNSIRYDTTKFTIEKEGPEKITLQIKDKKGLNGDSVWSFSLQDGRRRRDFRFKVILSGLAEGEDGDNIERPIVHIPLKSIKAGKKNLLVSIIPPNWESLIKIQNADDKNVWNRFISRISQDSIHSISSKIKIQSGNGSIKILLKKQNDYPQNDSAVFSINSPDTIFYFFFQISKDKTLKKKESNTSKQDVSEIINQAAGNIPEANRDTSVPSEKSTTEEDTSKGNSDEEPDPEIEPDTSLEEESDPPTVRV